MDVRKTVIDMLADQHAHLRKLLEEVEVTAGDKRRRAFDELRRFLAVHEAAEEIVTHRVVRSLKPVIVDNRLDEEHQVKEALAELEDIGVADARFDRKYAAFSKLVLDHVEAEEEFEFPLLEAALDPDQQLEVAQALRRVEDVAAAHPHPAAGETAVGNLAAATAEALADMVRDVAGSVLRR